MTITALGYISVVLAVYCIFRRNADYFILLCIFFSGWTGSAVMNFGSNGWSLMPSYFWAMLWIASMLIEHIKTKQMISLKSLHKEDITLYIFCGYACFSLILPLFYKDIPVISVTTGVLGYSNFSITNITQYIYLLFCVIFYAAFKNSICNNYSRYLSVYIWGIFSVCVVTFYQIIAFKLNLPFDALFRQSVHGNIQGTRIYGPCKEASELAYYLLPALPVCVHAKVNNKWINYITAAMCLTLGFISMSSTFIIGCLIWIICEIVNFIPIIKRNKKLIIYVIIVLACVLTIIYFTTKTFKNNILSTSINALKDKINIKTQSGIERSDSFITMINAWKRSPILGIGFGSSRGKDLFSTWLANTGIVGMALIISFLYQVLKNQGKHAYIRFANILVWFAIFTSVPEPYALFVWILAAMSFQHMNKYSERYNEEKTSSLNEVIANLFYRLKNKIARER